MEISITKMSQNGQIVIPSEIRKDAGIGPAEKFIVFNQNGNILLKKIRKETLSKEMELIEKVALSEKQIKKKQYTKVDSRMSSEEIDKALTK
jgi:AbrB family looped-hinge helix DNA binding protein